MIRIVASALEIIQKQNNQIFKKNGIEIAVVVLIWGKIFSYRVRTIERVTERDRASTARHSDVGAHDTQQHRMREKRTLAAQRFHSRLTMRCC